MLGEREVFAENLKRYMEMYDLSGRELSEMLGVSRTTPSTWLRGKAYPRIDLIEKMSNIFNCRKSDLVESDRTFAEISKVTTDEYKMILQWRTLDEATRTSLLQLMKRK